MASVLFTALPSWVNAQATEQSFSVSRGEVEATIQVASPPAGRVVSSLLSGLRSEIRYSIRVYEKGTGFFRFLGDRLIGNKQVDYEARWDEFTGEFIVSHPGQTVPISRFKNAAAFSQFFFAVRNEDTGIAVADRGAPYVLSSVQIQTIELVPPLTMIAPFLHSHQITTPWRRTPLLFADAAAGSVSADGSK